jgi:hypothetical protein
MDLDILSIMMRKYNSGYISFMLPTYVSNVFTDYNYSNNLISWICLNKSKDWIPVKLHRIRTKTQHFSFAVVTSDVWLNLHRTFIDFWGFPEPNRDVLYVTVGVHISNLQFLIHNSTKSNQICTFSNYAGYIILFTYCA